VFPFVQILADTIKFFYIFALLLVILWISGHSPHMSYFALPVVFAVALLFSAGVGFLVAAIVPLIPDLRFVIEQVLTVIMFLSGVVFSVSQVQPPLREFISLNPVAGLLEATRGILMHAQWPDWMLLGKVSLISALICAIGIAVVLHLAPRYPKLAV
jgi:lipopolysaccharide transport system permease protein